MYGWFPEMHLISFIVFVAVVISSTAARRCECHPLCCGKFCVQVFMLMLFLTVCSASNKYKEDTKNCFRGTVTPSDPYFFEGEDIVLDCSRRKGGWRKLMFLRGPNSEEVPEKYITKLNRTSIQLRIPNISKEDVDRTEISTFYRCVHKNNTKKCYGNVFVRLEYFLRTPVNLTCRDYNLDGMTCSWSLGVEEYHQQNAVNVSCSFKNGTEDVTSLHYKGERDWEPCPQLNNTACTWDTGSYPAPAPYFDVMVNVTNVVRKNSKVISKNFNKYDIVEPAPVSKLSHNASSHNASRRCLELKWKPPKQHISFVYDITYKSACADEKSMKTFSTCAEICDLVPHTKYNIDVKARLVRNDSSSGQWVERGHWSSPKHYDAMTHADVLDVNQKTFPGLYDISPSADGHASVTVYWTPLPSCDLHDAPESVTYKVTAHNVTSSVQHPAFNAQINIPEKKIINVTLQASNSVGHPESSRAVTVFPRTEGPHPSELIMQYNKTNKDCVTTADVVVRENSSRFSNITHTIVWCKGTQHICEEPLQWKGLEENVTSFMLPGNLCDADYRYGLVTNAYNRSQNLIVNTGILWEECIYKLGEVPSAPLEIDDNHALNHGFFVKWRHYDCNVIKAYITHYQVTYCSGAEKNEETCECIGEERRTYNKSRLNDTYSADDLTAGDNACVWIQGISKAGPGPKKGVYIEIAGQTNESLGAVVGAFTAIFTIVVIFVYCFRKYKSYREKNEISIPEYAEDIRDNQIDYDDQLNSDARLINSRTSDIGTGSGNEHFYQETETTGVQGSSAELPFLNHGQNEERNLDSEFKGYKNPESLHFDEDVSDDSVDEDESDVNNDLEVYDRQCNETLNVLDKQESIGNKQPEANCNKNGISVPNCEQNGREKNTDLKRIASSLLDERHLSITQCVNIEEIKNSKSLNRFKEEIELKSVDFNKQPSESQADEEEISFEKLTADVNDSPDGYEGVLCSGSTYTDSYYERPEVNTSMEDQDEKQAKSKPAHVSPDFHISSAIESFCKFTSEPVEKYDSNNLELGCKNNSDMTSYLSDAAESESESDIETNSDIHSSSEDFMSGYKQSKDICSISGSIGSLDSVSHESADQEMNKEQSSSNESNHDNSGTSVNVPSYIIKTDHILFEESNSKNPDENGKRKNGLVIKQ